MYDHVPRRWKLLSNFFEDCMKLIHLVISSFHIHKLTDCLYTADENDRFRNTRARSYILCFFFLHNRPEIFFFLKVLKKKLPHFKQKVLFYRILLFIGPVCVQLFFVFFLLQYIINSWIVYWVQKTVGLSYIRFLDIIRCFYN